MVDQNIAFRNARAREYAARIHTLNHRNLLLASSGHDIWRAKLESKSFFNLRAYDSLKSHLGDEQSQQSEEQPTGNGDHVSRFDVERVDELSFRYLPSNGPRISCGD